MALETGWPTLVASNDAWDVLFEGIPSSAITEWKAELASSGVEFAMAYSPGETKFPAVFTRLEDEKTEVQPMNFFTGRVDTLDGVKTQIDAFEVEETIGIYILAPSPQSARALFVGIRAIMVSSLDWLVQNGKYHSIEYLGGGDLEPESALLPETLGVFIRVQRWKAYSTAQVPNLALVNKPAFVHSTDVTVDSHTGGVSGSEE
jgi:hypothetical protein